MPISPHVLRRLQEVLGADAAEYLVQRMEATDTTRADLGELRHEMQLGFARTESLIEKGLREQTRFFFLAWAVLLAAFIGLYAK